MRTYDASGPVVNKTGLVPVLRELAILWQPQRGGQALNFVLNS